MSALIEPRTLSTLIVILVALFISLLLIVLCNRRRCTFQHRRRRHEFDVHKQTLAPGSSSSSLSNRASGVYIEPTDPSSQALITISTSPHNRQPPRHRASLTPIPKRT